MDRDRNQAEQQQSSSPQRSARTAAGSESIGLGEEKPCLTPRRKLMSVNEDEPEVEEVVEETPEDKIR